MFDSIGVPTRYDVLGVGRKEVCSYGERSSGFTHQGGRRCLAGETAVPGEQALDQFAAQYLLEQGSTTGTVLQCG
jgi:hypothetical protein